MKIIYNHTNNKKKVKFDYKLYATSPLETIYGVLNNETDKKKYNILTCIRGENLAAVDMGVDDVALLRTNNIHPFVSAINYAYSYSLPLIISPDTIWYLIMSAAAVYIKQNENDFKENIVQSNDAIKIKLINNENTSGPDLWVQFFDKISENLDTCSNNGKTFIADFTTTSEVSKNISQIVLMSSRGGGAVNRSMVGRRKIRRISEFRIDGCKEDWENVLKKTQKIIEIIPLFQKWYDSGLLFILNHFINSFDCTEIDTSIFWNEIYKSNIHTHLFFIRSFYSLLFKLMEMVYRGG